MPSRTILPASGVIAVLGGALMILGGLATNSLFLWILPLLRQEILDRIPSPANSAAELAVYIIALLVSLGGVTVILGGIPLLAGHRTTGRLLVALGGGAGFIGLILALGYYTWVNGIGGVGAHAGYWLASCSRLSPGGWRARGEVSSLRRIPHCDAGHQCLLCDERLL